MDGGIMFLCIGKVSIVGYKFSSNDFIESIKPQTRF